VAPPPGAVPDYPKGNVCFIAWVSAPGPTRLALKVLGPEGNVVGGAGSLDVGHKNRLAGERMGYRIWHWNSLRTSGEHQLILTDNDGRSLCRTRFTIE
jgi:hypothetical protein